MSSKVWRKSHNGIGLIVVVTIRGRWTACLGLKVKVLLLNRAYGVRNIIRQRYYIYDYYYLRYGIWTEYRTLYVGIHIIDRNHEHIIIKN